MTGALVAIVAAGLLAAGCAQSSTGQGSASAGGSTASTGPTATTAPPPLTSTPAGPTSSAPSPPTTSPNGRAAVVVVRGIVRKGVEPGCLLLDGQGKRYLLIDGPSAQLQEGLRVEVRGQPVDQIASFCGEEAALAVASVRPLR